MTNTTTALQALEDIAAKAEIAADMCEVSNLRGPMDGFRLISGIARAALAAPAPALDAPAELTLGPSGSADRYFYEAGFRAGARASQPTPAQDAAATVPNSTSIDEQIRRLADDPGVAEDPELLQVATNALARLAAPQVAPTAAQPVGVARVWRYCSDDKGEVAGDCWNTASVTFAPGWLEAQREGAEISLYVAPTTPQAPALVPLTDALLPVATNVRDYLQQTIDTQSTDLDDWRDDVSWAIKALTNGITPAGTTPKEQQ